MNSEKIKLLYCQLLNLEPQNITIDMIMKHWTLERELAQKMIKSNSSERVELFMDCYNALFSTCPWLLSTGTREISYQVNDWWIHTVPEFANILELGGGNASYAAHLGMLGFNVVSVDISQERVAEASNRLNSPNVKLMTVNSLYLPFDHNTFDVVFSNQMIEHLHPDDIQLHFNEVYRVLKTGGVYCFLTPNGLWGPFDISQIFGETKPSGMHLKEYSYGEILVPIVKAGFSKIKSPLLHPKLIFGKKQLYPGVQYKIIMEKLINKFPGSLKIKFGKIMAVECIMLSAKK